MYNKEEFSSFFHNKISCLVERKFLCLKQYVDFFNLLMQWYHSWTRMRFFVFQLHYRIFVFPFESKSFSVPQQNNYGLGQERDKIFICLLESRNISQSSHQLSSEPHEGRRTQCTFRIFLVSSPRCAQRTQFPFNKYIPHLYIYIDSSKILRTKIRIPIE